MGVPEKGRWVFSKWQVRKSSPEKGYWVDVANRNQTLTRINNSKIFFRETSAPDV